MHIQVYTKELRPDLMPVVYYLYWVTKIKAQWRDDGAFCYTASIVGSTRNERIASISRVGKDDEPLHAIIDELKSRHPGLIVSCT